MINITKLSGDHFLTIKHDKLKILDYREMKLLFDKNILIDSYYMLTYNYENIYTNFYDIYEMKFKNDIILDDLTINFLPYNYKDVEYFKTRSYNKSNFPDDNLRNDKLFVLMCLNKSYIFYSEISDELKYDKQIIYNAYMNIFLKFHTLNYIPIEYKNDKEFMKFYINICGSNIRYASDELKNDEELVNIAINNGNNHEVMRYLDDTYKDNEEFIKNILNKNVKLFEYISKRLQNKKEIIMLCIEKLVLSEDKTNYILKFINEENKNDKDIVLPLVSMNGTDIKYVKTNLSLDKDIVYAAVINNPLSYKFVDRSFFNDEKFKQLLCI